MEVSLSTSQCNEEDVVYKYQNLKSQHDKLTKTCDTLQQELHDTKRSHQTAIELKEHLYSEIEALQKTEKEIKAEALNKCKHMQDELDQIKEEKWKEAENFSNIIEGLEQRVTALKQERVSHCKEEENTTSLDSTKLLEDIRNYEQEITSLREANITLKTSFTENVALTEMQRAEIESLKERVQCVESNLKNKKEEMESLSEMLHATQEDLCTANMQLQQYKNSANTMAPKGNSLFAEVDDKRQEMLKSLTQMKDKVYQLNRELVCKQSEVDALMCEKKTLWEQYSGQANHHDATLFRAYERRITDLEKQTNQLNRDIARWFDKHIDPQSSEAAQWVSGLLEHYKKENSRLTSELTAASVNNLVVEQKLRELQRQIVAWRTKALEAKASISELETKLQTVEKSMLIANSTNIDTSPHPQTEMNMSKYTTKIKEELCITPKEGFSEVDISAIKKLDESRNESLRMKENQPPNISSILSVGNDITKVAKKTSFKQ